MIIKNLLTSVLACILMFILCACDTDGIPANEEAVEPRDLIVFAAASMTDTLTKLGEAYMVENQDVNIVFNFDSSGTLKTQIEEGADVDIFISAGQKQMDQLDINAPKDVNTDSLDFVLKGTRFNILQNKVCLVVPSANPANIKSYDDMIAKLREGAIILAMGNSDVPVGQYSQKILSYYGLSEDELTATGLVTYSSNAKEVTTQVLEGTVDCGIIYRTDAISAGLTIIDTATEEMCGQVIYPAAVMNISKNPETAKAFLEFLSSKAAYAVFEDVGFTPVK